MTLAVSLCRVPGQGGDGQRSQSGKRGAAGRAQGKRTQTPNPSPLPGWGPRRRGEMRGRVGRRRTAQGRRGPDARLPRDQALAAGTPPWAHLQLPSRSQPGVNRQMGAPQSSPTTPGGSPGSFCLSCSPPHAMLASLPPNISLLLTQIPTQAMRLLPEQL